MQEAYPRAATWLAASTHEGEEAFVLAAHKAAMARVAGLQLIIAPRHMNRASAIGKLAREMGLDVARRSAGDAPRSGAVYIADTMGEMALFYDQAHICLVGGSIVDRGGHTPFEPIAHECVILHGPHISNFQNIYRRLDAGGGAFQIGDVDEMAYLLAELQDPGRQDASRNLARELAAVEGAPDALVAKLLGLMGRR
ncbi:3-deoxy-D-manno-octulosonic acid transferase [Roseobacteraceae bacterium S113]